MEPLVSICIPTYNGARWLRESVDSALACTAETEILIVDDNSSDDSASIAREYAAKDSRVTVYVNEKNLGLVGNWNRCLDLARGTWIKFLFQDDVPAKGAIEKMLAAAGEYDLVAGYRNFIFDEESSGEARKYYTTKVLTLDKVAPGKKLFTAEDITHIAAGNPARNFIGEPSTVLFRRSVIGSLGKFDPELQQVCDLEFWIRIACQKGLVYVPEARVDFRVHEASVSAKNAGGRKFISTFLDPVRVVDAQLHDDRYSGFRMNLSNADNKKLRLWLRLHIYEAMKAAVSAEEKEEVEKLFNQRPHLGPLANHPLNPVLLRLLRLKRMSN
jgi:glycosyltransferase involved in cell wall biosynthesis